jgi:hypothetical protein
MSDERGTIEEREIVAVLGYATAMSEKWKKPWGETGLLL